jgi:hypothetical protein
MENKRNNNIEDILNSLDGSQRAAAPDFFYTRLRAKMEKGLTPQPTRGWKLKPAYVIAALILALSVNAAVLLKGNNGSTDGGGVVAIDESEQSIAAEYNLYENNIVYDLNQDK